MGWSGERLAIRKMKGKDSLGDSSFDLLVWVLTRELSSLSNPSRYSFTMAGDYLMRRDYIDEVTPSSRARRRGTSWGFELLVILTSSWRMLSTLWMCRKLFPSTSALSKAAW